MDEPKCPICGASMVLRQARRGPNKGKQFYGCSNYFNTKCKGLIEVDGAGGENKEANVNDINHFVPTRIIARPYYKGFEVFFCQSIAAPYEILEMINRDTVSIDHFRKFSQWRADYHINHKILIEPETRDVFKLMKKIMTRGTITLLSEKLEAGLKDLCGEGEITDFHLDCLLVHNGQGVKRQIYFDNSTYEQDFYNDALSQALGQYFNYHVFPQVSIESLIDSDKVSQAFEHGRIDFLITTDQSSYVIELDGSEHRGHNERDESRDKVLSQAGYKVIRISNEENFVKVGKELQYLVTSAYTYRSLSNTEKYLVACKIAHQIMITLLEVLLNGYDFLGSNTVYINIPQAHFDQEQFCIIVQNEFNDLFTHVGRLMQVQVQPITLKPYEVATNDLVISFTDECIDLPNVTVITDVYINKTISNPSSSTQLRYYEAPVKEDLEYFLDYIFRKPGFREGQLETIMRGLQGKDTLVLLPTGAGKSIAFQLTSLLLNGVTLVIDPIIALINDQIENLNRIGIDRVTGITSLISDHQTRRKTMDAFSMGEYMISYISPERMQSEEFRRAIKGLTTITPIPLVAIDEAHCVSEWGHDFRTSYLNIGRISREYCGLGTIKPCLIGLTGTASNSVLRDVQRELDIKDFDAIITPKTFDRKELSYNIFACRSEEKEFILKNLLERYLPGEFQTSSSTFFSQHGDATKCGLVFCPHVNGQFGVAQVARKINEETGLPVNIYSGEKPKGYPSPNWNEHKNRTARDFKNNNFNIMVATKAFGMGIDKPNINYTVHYGLPTSIESFYQEAGRAGRNGKFSKCVLMVSNDNPARSQKMLDPQTPIDELRNTMDNAINLSNADDVSRALFFHINSFKGIEEEAKCINFLLDKIGDLGTSRKMVVKASDEFKRAAIEKALYRLIVLGPVRDYTINYSSEEFTFDYRVMDRDEVIDRYAMYVAGYNKTRLNRETEKLQVLFDLSYKEFLLGSSKVLISFIYDTIEKGRRRGISEVLSMSEAALKSDDPDLTMRNRILNYLETTYSEEIEKILNVDRLSLELIRDLIDGYETSDGRIIGGLRSSKDAAEVRGQVSRYLESTPDHPGLLILRALSELFCSDYDKSVVIGTLEAAINYANEQIGYSLYAGEFYKMIAWSVVRMGERDLNIYTELASDLLERFDKIEFAEFILHFAPFHKEFLLLPTRFITNKNCQRIDEIMRRKQNVGA